MNRGGYWCAARNINVNTELRVKIMKNITVLAIAAVALLMAAPTPSKAADDNIAASPKTRQLLSELKPVKTKADVAALKPGDTIAVACSHCKAIWVSVVPEKGAEKLVKFQGEDKVECKKCGSPDAFCCAGSAAK